MSFCQYTKIHLQHVTKLATSGESGRGTIFRSAKASNLINEALGHYLRNALSAWKVHDFENRRDACTRSLYELAASGIAFSAPRHHSPPVEMTGCNSDY